MTTYFSKDQIKRTIEFHGHQCPGLAIGIRAAELCLRELGHHDDSPIVAICETDMCGVDAIQFLTGCSVGKGNLILKDHGKMAFTFYRRKDGKGIRAMLNPDFIGELRADMGRLMGLAEPTAEEKEQCTQVRAECEKQYYAAKLADMFIKQEPQIKMPRPAAILQSLTCENCGEIHMESRSRRFAGRTLCLTCFEKVEQKM
ncbi:FmdE family protein [Desulfovibrio sp. JC022]|uniref:FmdE family protein n=1 Tax=Desulfovibrio sp. JC022 TaxID=2593642 RepID=UPI0013CF48AA|nr:FmdE family protein [Desulfovibrio sp. JC022]NDV24020.1 formylmethanofuran dehydrogenase [Desulfovibrio sp. JC022]